MQDTDIASGEVGVVDMNVNSGTNTDLTLTALQTSIRKARKDASRAESSMRHEIEAIKRGLERMSDVDHRSKQKLLALQENTRQASLHTKEITVETESIEAQRPEWEVQEREKTEELETVRQDIERKMQIGYDQIKRDDDELLSVEKELQRIKNSIEDQQASKEKMEHGRMSELEQDLAKIQQEIDRTLQAPALSQHNYHHPHAADLSPFDQAALPSQYTGSSFIPPQVAGRGRARNSRGYRNVSGPGGGSKRAHHRQRQHGPFHTMGGGSFSDEQHDDNPQASTSPHISSLNPYNPEFIPSGSANASPLVSRPVVLPPQEDSSSLSINPHLPFSVQESNYPRRGSTGLLDVSMAANTAAASWSVGRTSPWNQASMNHAPSPQTDHDIWGIRSPNGSSPALQGTPSPLQHASPTVGPAPELHTKTSVPFGLSSTLLRGGANPSYAQSRLSDSHQFDSYAPSHTSQGPSEKSHWPPTSTIHSNSGRSRAPLPVRPVGFGRHYETTGGSSAPVSPTTLNFDLQSTTFSTFANEGPN